MLIFNPADKVIMQLLGMQTLKKDKKVRALKWTIRFPADNGIIIYNFLTGEGICFENDKEIEEKSEYLFTRYFFVPEDHDDRRLVDELRAAVRLINQTEDITSYKILTTTDCNARCAYCYELGMKREDMSIETAGKVVDYIKKHYGGKKVTLAWFGGEPLLNTGVIDHICMEMVNAGIDYTSVMTSNGYLFDQELADKAKKLWRLNNIQITLDGTGDNYNRIKAYVDAADDPYVRVLDNIKKLTEHEIHVNVRLNMDLENFVDLCDLAEELGKRFHGNEFFDVYASGLFQDTEAEGETEKKKRLFESLGVLRKLLHEKGFGRKSVKKLKLKTSACMADGDNHRGISPTGRLMKCEHHIFTRLTGDIRDEKEDKALLSEWKAMMPYGEICDDCPALPVCYKLLNCPVSHICSTEEKKQYIDSLIEVLTDVNALFSSSDPGTE